MYCAKKRVKNLVMTTSKILENSSRGRKMEKFFELRLDRREREEKKTLSVIGLL
jgi:hypothetical protein